MLDKGVSNAEKLKMETHIAGNLEFSGFFVFKTKTNRHCGDHDTARDTHRVSKQAPRQ